MKKIKETIPRDPVPSPDESKAIIDRIWNSICIDTRIINNETTNPTYEFGVLSGRLTRNVSALRKRFDLEDSQVRFLSKVAAAWSAEANAKQAAREQAIAKAIAEQAARELAEWNYNQSCRSYHC
jgi:endonuclease V-like protein UPF0215 family